jgi:hypothetical protein
MVATNGRTVTVFGGTIVRIFALADLSDVRPRPDQIAAGAAAEPPKSAMNLRRRISAPKVRRQHLIGLNESFNRGYRLRLIVRSAQPMSAPDPIASLWPCDGNFRFAPDSGRGIAITDAMCPKPTFAGIAAFGAKRTYVQTTRSEKRQKGGTVRILRCAIRVMGRTQGTAQ